MLSDSIKFGDRVEITQKRDISGVTVYVSQVENIIDARTILIQMPLSYGKLVKLPLNEPHSFLFITEIGMLRYDAAVTGYTKEDGFHFMTVKLLSDGEKTQRRQSFRFSCLLPLHFYRIDEDYLEKIQDPAYQKKMAEAITYEGIVKDISGGGIRFISNAELLAGDRIKSVIVINSDYIITLGKVLPLINYFPKSKYRYQYRVVFTGVSYADQEKIIQYIFNEQLKMKQKSIYGTNE